MHADKNESSGTCSVIFSFLKFASVLFFLCFSSCHAVPVGTAQQIFGNDSEYFMALRAADEGNSEKSLRYFKRAEKKGSGIVALRSAESLTLLGNAQERLEAAKTLALRFKDEEAALIACREFSRQNELNLILNLTNELDLASASNELVKIRIETLLKKNDNRFEPEYFNWCISRPLSMEHLELYQSYHSFKMVEFKELQAKVQDEYEKELKNLEIRRKFAPVEEPDEKISTLEETLSKLEMPVTREQKLIDFRVSVYRRNYYAANSAISEIMKLYDSENDVHPQILSDLGKAALYGTMDYLSSAKYFDRLASKIENSNSFYPYFYAARLYDKAGRYQKQTLSRFKSALEVTDDSRQFDNCLWYLLNFQLRTSVDDIIGTLKTYGGKITDSEYFDDFFDSLSVLLLSNQKWQDFYKVWKETDSNFSQNTAGKYAYISGRIIEDGLAEGDAGLKTRQAVDAFTKVLAGGGSIYYKACALERLNVLDPQLVETYLLTKGEKTDRDWDVLAGNLLNGYAKFGFPQKIYPEWRRNRSSVSETSAIAASRFLKDCGKFAPEYNVQSLRIAGLVFADSTGKVSKELLELTFPKIYEKEIEKVCREYEIPPYMFFALVRSESFFDSAISSSAGACGLTQLMESTAADVAAKLKIENYDIYDPETNLNFGSYYLANLLSRVEGNSPILALFAYNAGLTNVRNWISSARKDWSVTGKASRRPAGISMDLFLETLPFTETREYGRKLVEASVMYGWLYYGKNPAETVREMLYNQ